VGIDAWWVGLPTIVGWSVWQRRQGKPPPLGYRRVSGLPIPRWLMTLALMAAGLAGWALLMPRRLSDDAALAGLLIWGVGVAAWVLMRGPRSGRWWLPAALALAALVLMGMTLGG
jgi:hypothetical protein